VAEVLSAAGVRFRYGALTVLDGVDFAVHAAEAVGIVGPNGAGKTSLLNVLTGACRPAAGTVRLGGRDVTRLDAAARCRLGLGRSHQVPRPFSGMTVIENTMTAATHGGGLSGAAARERCLEVLALARMTPLANRRAETLGLLERKRLELARALAIGPRVLLLDEIGGGLTDGEAAELVCIVREIRRRGVAIVWIEHIVHVLLQVVDRLVCMDAGRVIAAGEPQAVLASAAVVDAYLGGVQ
jgi:branched-chain amino acid transport system ATP-binding protein